MKKYGRSLLAVLLTAAMFFLCLGPSVSLASVFGTQPRYLKSVTYFGDEWAINFWNSEDQDMDADFARIAGDGFNSIILVVPWREFQPKMSPNTYNQYALDKLDRVMEAAANHGLWVSLRVGYTWDYYSAENASDRYEKLLGDKSVKSAWLDYVETVYETASAHPNLYGGFLTWEDFWNFTYKVSSMGGYDRVQNAEICGYTNYLREHYTLEELSQIYEENIQNYNQVYLPRYSQPAAKLFYEFYDDFLNRLLADSQQKFPGLSMEVRLDGEPLKDLDGNTYFYNHRSTYACQGADYVAAMYSVSMKQNNNYETLEASQAINTAVAVLDETLAYTGGKPLYLEQFLFMDSTEEFSYNAQLREDQRTSFLLEMVPVLRPRIMGYGLWVYQNYGNNLVYNPQFAVNTAGWIWSDGSRVVERAGTPVAMLVPGSQVKQKLTGRISLRNKAPILVRFTADSDVPANLQVFIGNGMQTVKVDGKAQYQLEFAGGGNIDIIFQSSGQIYVDNVKVYTYEQDGQIYDMDGNPLSCLETVRTVNQKLK